MKKTPPAPLSYDQQARVLNLACVYWRVWNGGSTKSVQDGAVGALNGLIDTMRVMGWRVRDDSTIPSVPLFTIERIEDE